MRVHTTQRLTDERYHTTVSWAFTELWLLKPFFCQLTHNQLAHAAGYNIDWVLRQYDLNATLITSI